MGSRVRSGFRLLVLSRPARWASVSALGLALGCGGGDGQGLFGGNDETTEDDAGIGGGTADAATSNTGESNTPGPNSESTQTSSSGASTNDGSGSSSDTSITSNGSMDSTSRPVTDPTSSDGFSSAPTDSTSTFASTGSDSTSTFASTGSDSTLTFTDSTSADPTSSDSLSTSADPTSSDSLSTSSDPTSEPIPTCAITTPSKVLLNGVLAPAGDRASSVEPYAIRVEVTTSQPEGSDVQLTVSDGAPLSETVQDGVAVFDLVALPEAGSSSLQATCEGNPAVQSDTVDVNVDTQPPTLDESNLWPTDGQQLLPSDDQDPDAPGTDFDVCVPITSADALATGSDNVCVSLGATEVCAAATLLGGGDGLDGACVRMHCEGDEPFDLELVVLDEAGNPTTHSVEDVRCATSSLVVEIADRRQTSFQLDWTESAEPVTGYEIAFTKVSADDAPPIDADSFDDATGIEVVAADAHSLLLENLSIEQRYHFAVRPILESNNEGPVLATSAPLRARFETQVIAPPPNSAGNQWGYSVDASTDLNGDGASELIVGQAAGDRVTIYFGHVGGAFSTVPDVTINGPEASRFGVSVAAVGNVQGNATQFIAIAASDFDVNGRVYLLPTSALNQSVIDLTDGDNPLGPVVDFPAGPGYPLHVARLGDFDGNDVDDFAIHAPALGQNGACDFDTGVNCDGALVVVRGGVGMPSTINVPADTDWTFAFFPSTFGYYGIDWLLGIPNANGELSGVLAAEWQGGVSRLITYDEFESEEYVTQTLSVGEPEFDEDGNTLFDTELGLYPHVLVSASRVAVQMTGGRDGGGVGVVEIYNLDAANTFSVAPTLSLTALGNNNNAGQILISSRFGGRQLDYSKPLFGNQVGAPLVLAGRFYNNNLPVLYMLRSQTLAALPTDQGEVDVAVVADVALDLATIQGISADWADGPGVERLTGDWHGGLGFGVHDLNADGYMDLGVTEWTALDPDYTGGIVVLY